MATRNITFTLLNAVSSDLAAELHQLTSDALNILLVTDVLTAATASDFALTEVTGNNYTAGGIACAQTLDVSGNIVTVQSAVDFLWSEDASGFTNANFAVIRNQTSGRIIAIADIREGGTTAVSSAAQDVDINLENGSDLFTIGV